MSMALRAGLRDVGLTFLHRRRGCLPLTDLSGCDGNAVQECGDVGDLLVRQRYRRHSAPTFLDDRADQLAVEHGRRAQEVRTATVTATRVRPVAERIVHTPECLASFDGRRIARRSLRVGDKAAAARTALLSRRGRDDARDGERAGDERSSSASVADEVWPCKRLQASRTRRTPASAIENRRRT